MLDALKFAFEILIVGVLALPWLAILIRLFDSNPASENPNADLSNPLTTRPSKIDPPFPLSVLPDSAQSALATVFVIAVGYLLGSAVSRVSRDFFNDELLGRAPREDTIREGVYFDEYCNEDVLGDRELPVKGHARFPKTLCEKGPDNVGSITGSGLYKAPASIVSTQTVTLTATSATDPTWKDTATIILKPSKGVIDPPAAELEAGQTTMFKATGTGSPDPTIRWSLGSLEPASPPEPANRPKYFEKRVEEMFLLQESVLLLSGQDKVDRLRQYYDQITVLRGAAFNGIILSFLALSGYLANAGRGRPWQRVWKALAYVFAGVLIIYALYSLRNHFQQQADLYIHPPLGELVLLLLGVVSFFVISKAKRESFYLPTCTVAVVLTFAAFGGWWKTEIMYDLQVIHSQPELLGPQPGSK
jgi:hypothetical protein